MMEIFSDVKSYFVAFTVVYFVLQFFDIIFKSCMFYPYFVMMNNLGITIKPYMMVWRFTMFNEIFLKMGRIMPNLLKRWFNTGFYLSVLSMCAAFVLLTLPIIDYVSEKLPSPKEEVTHSVVPGLTAPFSHIVYIIPGIIISVIFHEFGHALAASREKVPIESCGLALFLIFPVAFVNLDQRRINFCTSIQQLRVYCAGIWHNLVLFFLSALFIMFSKDILYPHFKTDLGVTVLHVEKESSLAHIGGLLKGNVITSVNDCEVRDMLTWFHCLEDISISPQLGFCSSKQFIHNYGNISHCCTNSSDRLCFKMLTDEEDDFVCLPARKVVDGGTFCQNNSDCSTNLCLTPFLSPNDHKLIRMQRNSEKSVLFIGSVNEIYFSVKVSSWISNVKFPSVAMITHFEYFCKYLMGISAGLIIMNAIPCYLLDGGFIIENLIDFSYRLFKSKIRSERRHSLAGKFKAIGLVLLVFNVVLGLKNMRAINK